MIITIKHRDNHSKKKGKNKHNNYNSNSQVKVIPDIIKSKSFNEIISNLISDVDIEQDCFALSYYANNPKHFLPFNENNGGEISPMNSFSPPSSWPGINTPFSPNVRRRSWKEDEDDIASVSTVASISTSSHALSISNQSRLNLQNENDKNILPRKRFLPLIIDEEHGERALPLLIEELLRLDRQLNDFYESPIVFQQKPIPSGGQHDLRLKKLVIPQAIQHT